MVNDFFKYFEKEHHIILSVYQKRAFIQAVKNKTTTYVYGLRGGKTMLLKMVEEYKEWNKKSKDFIICKNTKCSYNQAYDNRSEQNLLCSKITNNDLLNRKSCEEREW